MDRYTVYILMSMKTYYKNVILHIDKHIEHHSSQNPSTVYSKFQVAFKI